MRKISIITVCFNSEKTIKNTFDSILSQKKNNLELEYIVVDGGSIDNTKTIIKKYQEFFKDNKIDFKYISEEDEGIYDAMNKGIKIATGDIIGILNSDDYYEENILKIVLDKLQNRTMTILHGNMRLINKNGMIIKKPKKINPKYLKYGMVFFHPTFFVTKDVYENIGNFNKNLKVAGDFDFAYRSYKNKINYLYINQVLTNFRIGGESSNNSNVGFKECRDILKLDNRNKLYLYIIYFYKIIKTKIYLKFFM